MRIAVFHEVSSGGARRAINMYAKQLKKNNTVDLFTSESLTNSEKKYYSHVFTYPFKIPEWKGKNFKKKLYTDTIALWRLNILHKKIAKDIQNDLYDVVFVNPSRHIQSPFILNHLKIPKVFYLHDPHYRILYEKELEIPYSVGAMKYVYENLNRSIRKIIDRNNLLQANIYLANSSYTKTIAKKSYGVESVICYLGVDHSYFQLSEKKRDIDVLYVGSTKEVDDFRFVKKVFTQLPDSILTSLVLTDKKWYKDDALRALYQRAKIVLSTTRNEPFGLVPLEAMASGAIALSINEAGYKDSIINGETGYLVERNENFLALAIFRICKNEKNRLAMQKRARKEVESNWTWEKAGKKLENILRKVSKQS